MPLLSSEMFAFVLFVDTQDDPIRYPKIYLKRYPKRYPMGGFGGEW